MFGVAVKNDLFSLSGLRLTLCLCQGVEINFILGW